MLAVAASAPSRLSVAVRAVGALDLVRHAAIAVQPRALLARRRYRGEQEPEAAQAREVATRLLHREYGFANTAP